MSHPFITTDLAHIHIAELRAEADNARTARRRSRRSIWPASLSRRRGRAGPALQLVGNQPAPARPAPSSTGGNRAA